ncbi:MAG: carotenoid biosynthesis protein [Caldisericia bacterium]
MTSNKNIIRLVFFLLILFIIPFVLEYIGINFGAPLGVRYFYLKEFLPQIFGLPLVILLFWVIFIYIGYSLTNSIFTYFFKENYNDILKKNLNIIFLSLLDGFIVLTFDIFIDPVAVKFGLWRWENFYFSYFGVPIGNFVGWYIIATTTTLFLRSLDLIFSVEINKKWLNLVPYVYIFIEFLLFFITFFLHSIDSAVMSLIICSPINIIIFVKLFEKVKN